MTRQFAFKAAHEVGVQGVHVGGVQGAQGVQGAHEVGIQGAHGVQGVQVGGVRQSLVMEG